MFRNVVSFVLIAIFLFVIRVSSTALLSCRSVEVSKKLACLVEFTIAIDGVTCTL